VSAIVDPKRTVVIENVAPAVDGGRYPVKREAGTVLEVSADIFTEGHDVLVAFLKYQRADEPGSLISILQEFAARRINLRSPWRKWQAPGSFRATSRAPMPSWSRASSIR